MAPRKQTDDEFGEQLLRFLAEPENAARVSQALEAGLRAAQDASWHERNRARLALEETWYGPPPEPPAARRAIATRTFEHAGQTVKFGDIHSTADLVVQQVGHCFAIAED